MILIIPYMAYLSRMAGGGWPKLPWNTDQLLYAIPAFFLWPLIGYWSIAAYLWLAITKLMGTRQYLDGGTWDGPIRKPNNVDFLISWLRPYVSHETYDFIGNTIIGFIHGIGPCVILTYFGYAGYAILIPAMMRGFAYAIGWGLDSKEGSKWGEYLSGGFVGFGIWILL